MLSKFLLFIGIVILSKAANVPSNGRPFVLFTKDERGTPMAHISIPMAKLFPDVPYQLSGFDLDVGYTNYNQTLFQRVAESLSNEDLSFNDKIATTVTVLYGKEYHKGADTEMDTDFTRLYEAVHPSYFKQLDARSNAYVDWSRKYAINLVTCRAFLSCISGVTCGFYVTIDKAPRSRCESQGGQNCCLSWATYTVKAGFFQVTWTDCYNSRPANVESCEGYDNGSGNGGDVCFSNRATGCT